MATINDRDGKIKFTDDAKTIKQLAEENKANLQDADLRGAKITKAQIDDIIQGTGGNRRVNGRSNINQRQVLRERRHRENYN